MAIIPASWLPNASMKRIILHWTGGRYKANSVDKAAYHILIENDGDLVLGSRSIKDNTSTSDGVYAAHTKGCNTGSIGVTVCCMAGATNPSNLGSFPMLQKQFDVMVDVTAELCDFYDIPVTNRTVLGHVEVQPVLGIRQDNKWDPWVLTWMPGKTPFQIGDEFRSLVKAKLTGVSRMEEAVANITAVVNGERFIQAQIYNEKSYIKLRQLIEKFDWQIVGADEAKVSLKFSSSATPKSLPFILIDTANNMIDISTGSTSAQIITLIERNGFVAARDLASDQGLNLPIDWNGDTRTVTIG
ncbi:N-acetylmuramoyl-L-alanine amidase [Leptolyngbya sp. PL-A3]|uniref:peptidoglycan recognition protein family protein n=1 Tax=Leptolyngbya sp. PL-A3 TaxID=2933911 RepID=UPI00329A7B66